MRGEVVVGMQGICLDLKGLPPTIGRLMSMLDLLAAARINCMVVERENSFPWDVDRRYRSETAYSPASAWVVSSLRRGSPCAKRYALRSKMSQSRLLKRGLSVEPAMWGVKITLGNRQSG